MTITGIFEIYWMVVVGLVFVGAAVSSASKGKGPSKKLKSHAPNPSQTHNKANTNGYL